MLGLGDNNDTLIKTWNPGINDVGSHFKMKTYWILISLILSFSIGSFFYLLVLQLPIISKSRLLISFLISLGVMWLIYKTIKQIWEKSCNKIIYIVLFASFIGLIITSALFYFPRTSYLFYGQHELDVFLYTYKGLESYKLFFGIVIFSLIFAALIFLESLSQKTKRYYIILAFLGGFLIKYGSPI